MKNLSIWIAFALMISPLSTTNAQLFKNIRKILSGGDTGFLLKKVFGNSGI